MAKKRGKKKKNTKNIAIGIAAVLIIAFSGYSYEEGYFPGEFYPGEKDEITAGAFHLSTRFPTK